MFKWGENLELLSSNSNLEFSFTTLSLMYIRVYVCVGIAGGQTKTLTKNNFTYHSAELLFLLFFSRH